MFFLLPPSGLAHRGAALLFVNNGFRPCNKMMNASRALVPAVIIKIRHFNGFPYGINKVRIIIALYLAASRISVDICDTNTLALLARHFRLVAEDRRASAGISNSTTRPLAFL